MSRCLVREVGGKKLLGKGNNEGCVVGFCSPPQNSEDTAWGRERVGKGDSEHSMHDSLLVVVSSSLSLKL